MFSKITINKAEASLVYISKSFSGKENLGLSDKESKYVKEQIEKNEKKLVVINQLNRLVAVAIIDDKKNHNQQLEIFRKAGNTICLALNEIKAADVTLQSSEKADYTMALAEGMALGNYQFIHHKKSAKKEKNTLAQINILSKEVSAELINEFKVLVDATYQTRDLVNEPVNILNATGLANAFKKMGKAAGFSVEVYNKAKIKSLKMGGLLSVNQGSIDEPTFSIMEYKPKNAKNKKPYVLVGKGVVYDTGGLSLKPTPNSMDMMKCDMAGAAGVAGAIYAVAKAKLPVHVIALVPATDNRPGENAFAPGDIITMMDGSTVEMLNSDAEGRMILGDALHFAKKYKPELVIDMATLTGAAAAAIGTFGIVSMGTADEKTHSKLKESGNTTHERLAEFPFWDEYDDLIKSDIADMKNLGGPQGGSITAGKFLARYTDYPYIHLDIAGPAFLTAREAYKPKGGTGVGVRLLYNFLKNV